MDVLTASDRSRVMASIPSRNTRPEIAVRKIVHGMGYRFRLHAKNLPGRPDMVFSSRAKVIFVHGCFWHAHKNCKNFRPPKSKKNYWVPKLERNAERDKEVRKELRNLGWASMVIWECQLSRPKQLSSRIRRFLDGDHIDRSDSASNARCAFGSSSFNSIIPNESAAILWFESKLWPNGRHCPHCGSENTVNVSCNKPQPYRCRDCRRYFSCKTGTAMKSSKLSVRQWLYAVYLMSSNKKGLSSRQLAKELGVGQVAAWRLGQKIRDVWNKGSLFPTR